MIGRLPLVDQHWRPDVRRIEAVLLAVDTESIVAAPPPVEGRREMTRVELRILVSMLYGLAMSKPLVPWIVVRNCVVEVVTILTSVGVNPTHVLEWANLVPRFLHRCNLQQDYQVGESTCSGPHGRDVTNLLLVMEDLGDFANLLSREQDVCWDEIVFLRDELSRDGEEPVLLEELSHLEQVYTRVNWESADMALVHLHGL